MLEKNIFAELFEESGMNGYDKGEKTFGDPDETKNNSKEKKRMPSTYQDMLDLHGIKTVDAPEIVEKYINKSRGMGYKFVLITFGIGRNSPEGKSKLRPIVIRKLIELENQHRLKKFKTADPKDCGMGSVYVYLR
ncbi:hypothetical protein GF376_04375 [Candidatus Peregrinibacteria bacterium]|nr:hypothetical protein [Candidatus Peregrinibacteria bacterium]